PRILTDSLSPQACRSTRRESSSRTSDPRCAKRDEIKITLALACLDDMPDIFEEGVGVLSGADKIAAAWIVATGISRKPDCGHAVHPRFEDAVLIPRRTGFDVNFDAVPLRWVDHLWIWSRHLISSRAGVKVDRPTARNALSNKPDTVCP